MTIHFSGATARRALLVPTLVLAAAAPAAFAARAKPPGYVSTKPPVTLGVNQKGTGLTSVQVSCSKGAVQVSQAFVHQRPIGGGGAFSYSGSATKSAGTKSTKVHLGLTGRFVNANTAVGAFKTSACARGKLVHFTAHHVNGG